MLALSGKWHKQLDSMGETGMGYIIVSVILKNGKRYDQVIIDSGFLTRIKGMKGIPFTEEDISQIIATNDAWDFRSEEI